VSEPRKVFEASGSGAAGVVALIAFFVVVAAVVIGVCWAGAWMVVNTR